MNCVVQRYTFIDYATQGYTALVGLLILFFRSDAISAWPLLLLAHVVCLGLVHWLISFHATRKPGGLLEVLRGFYPVILYTPFYRETGLLNQMFFSGYLDPVLIRLENRLLGGQPSLIFMDRLPYLAVSEIFYAAYFSYYVMIVGVGIALFVRKREQFIHYVSIVSFVFYVCYWLYIFLPVIGPRIFFRELADYRLPDDVQPLGLVEYPATVQSGPFYQIMAIIYRCFEAPGAAFPSSHIAVAICTLYFTFLYLRRIRVIHFVAVILLSAATVYCRYHYVVDVLAGALTAGVLIPLGNWLYLRWQIPTQSRRNNLVPLDTERRV